MQSPVTDKVICYGRNAWLMSVSLMYCFKFLGLSWQSVRQNRSFRPRKYLLGSHWYRTTNLTIKTENTAVRGILKNNSLHISWKLQEWFTAEKMFCFLAVYAASWVVSALHIRDVTGQIMSLMVNCFLCPSGQDCRQQLLTIINTKTFQFNEHCKGD